MTASIQLRNMGYSAAIINFNLLLYVLIKECTRDMANMALSKMTRGVTDARTSSIIALTFVALGCCPLFFVYMLLSPIMLFKADLVVLLTVVFALNIACWVLIALLLNLEFFSAMVRFKAEYDIFISYRVSTDASLVRCFRLDIWGFARSSPAPLYSCACTRCVRAGPRSVQVTPPRAATRLSG